MITIEQAPAYLLVQLEALDPLASNRRRDCLQGMKSTKTSVEVDDKDDLLQGDCAGVVQLLHDGRLPLQVVEDVGDVDHVKRHHLRSHLLAQDGSSARSTLPKDPFPRVVGVSL